MDVAFDLRPRLNHTTSTSVLLEVAPGDSRNFLVGPNQQIPEENDALEK